MRFSIVTPSFRNSEWLRLCIASVADQEGVEVEHIVQDAGSNDGTLDWLTQDQRVRAYVEKDAGMYDAINRGLNRASGEVVSYLNCDEQYLAGALEKICRFFTQRPELDLAFGDALVVDRQGRYICHRQTLLPSLRHTVACHLGILSCALFFRRRLVERGFLFDPSFRVAGDADFLVRCLQAGLPMAHLPHLLSTFTDSGNNLGLSRAADQEARLIQSRFPAWWTRARLVWAAAHRFRRWRAGYYRPQPVRYEIYTLAQPGRRTEFQVTSPAFLWRKRFRLDR